MRISLLRSDFCVSGVINAIVFSDLLNSSVAIPLQSAPDIFTPAFSALPLRIRQFDISVTYIQGGPKSKPLYQMIKKSY